MRVGRLVLALAALAAVVWAIQNRESLLRRVHAPDAAAAAASRSDSALTEAAREADKAQGGGVTDNMTPDQVRSVLGTPDSVESVPTDNGKTREKWIYRQAGKAVVFENGIAISVEAP